MASDAKSVSLKVFVDERKKKVMFAEAEEDFVEILFSFFILPLGRIVRFLNTQEDLNDTKLGSFTSLYKSVQSISDVNFVQRWSKNYLLNPYSSSADLCKKLKVNLHDANAYDVHSLQFLKRKGSFIITDDLNVTPFTLEESIQFLNTLGVEYADLVEKTINFDAEDFLNLLKWSLCTNTPLTNLILGSSSNYPCLSSCSCFISSDSLSNTAQPQTIKLLVQKSKKKVLCAQVDSFFVELLLNFLTIPLGTVKHLTMDKNDSSVGINNLYSSISSLEDGNYLKTENVKRNLLEPKVSTYHDRVTDFLPIYQVEARPGSFLKDQSSFLVSDDLEITVSPSISTISKFTFGIRGDDIEVLQVSIGEREALLILKACFTTTSVLTHCLDAFRKSPKVKTST